MRFYTMNTKKPKFPIVIKRGSCAVKIYRDQKPQGTYFRVAYHLGGKRQRLNFCDLEAATNEAKAKASQLSRGDDGRALRETANGSRSGAKCRKNQRYPRATS